MQPSSAPLIRRQGPVTWLRRLIELGVIGLLLLVGVYQSFNGLSHGRIYRSVGELPEGVLAALVLGTSERTQGGQANPWFEARMRAATDLYTQGGVRVLIVSGDSRTPQYSEPRMMARALREAGVPEAAIWEDHAGVRTINSVVRCRQVYGQQQVIIVSQRFHLQRALVLARATGLDAYGLMADDGPPSGQVWLILREMGARLLAIWELLMIYAGQF